MLFLLSALSLCPKVKPGSGGSGSTWQWSNGLGNLQLAPAREPGQGLHRDHRHRRIPLLHRLLHNSPPRCPRRPPGGEHSAPLGMRVRQRSSRSRRPSPLTPMPHGFMSFGLEAENRYLESIEQEQAPELPATCFSLLNSRTFFSLSLASQRPTTKMPYC